MPSAKCANAWTSARASWWSISPAPSASAPSDPPGAKEPEARAALLPLALSALEKLRRESPAEAITGPAARGDLDTIAAHRRVLPRDLLALYDQLTRVSLALRRLRAEALPESAPANRSSRRRRPPPPAERPAASSRSRARYGPRPAPPPPGPSPRRPR